MKAYIENDLAKVYKLQQQLVRSFAARSLAVRKVATNQGRKTPGVDGITLETSSDKFETISLVKDLKDYKASPVRRVYIPKSNGKLRPLGIPTIKDRVVQTLFLFALEPIGEETADSRSYGFRPYRGVHDNATYLNLVLSSYTATRRFILDADIEGFFDSVGHNWLMANIPMDKKILKEFLSAGFVDGTEFHKTSLGFPQGSPISPLLANMALNGLQAHIGKEFLFTRYADDFLVLGKSVEDLKKSAMPSVNEFLKLRGLSLNKSKTSVTEISKGFNYLSFNFREYKDKTRIKGTKKGILLVKPSNRNVKRFKKEITNLVHEHRNKPILALIQSLNMKLRGWAEHFRTVTSQEVFSSISYHLWKVCWTMLRKKHRRRNAAWIKERYFTKVDGNKWILCSKRRDGEIEIKLFQIAYVDIKRHTLCKSLNPYDPENYEYFSKRRTRSARVSLLLGKVRTSLLRRQRGLCPVCKTSLLNGEDLEVHHVKPKSLGGSDKLSNLRLLHKECHKQITHSKDERLLAAWRSENIIH